MGLQIKRAHISWVSQHRNAASQRGGGEGLRLQSQEGQDLCSAAAAEHLIFKTRTEEQTVDLPNNGMTKDSKRVSPWFHNAKFTVFPFKILFPLFESWFSEIGNLPLCLNVRWDVFEFKCLGSGATV